MKGQSRKRVQVEMMLKEVLEFYEKYPYPNLPIRNRKDLTNKMHANVMRNILNTAGLTAKSLRDKAVLDAGCGTGEKACYFSFYGANSVGVDISSSSLKIAMENSRRLKLKTHFVKSDLLNLSLRRKFDHIFSMGVLHHTSNPYKGFRILVKHLRKNGTITIGLYNSYGRFLHRMKRGFLKLVNGKSSEKKLAWLAKNIYKREFKSKHELAFAADKYAHPHETYHSIEEVLGWFRSEGIELIGIYPRTGKNFTLTQIRWLFERKGFFIVSGKKVKG